MKIFYDWLFDRKNLDGLEEIVENIVDLSLEEEEFDKNVEVSISLVSDQDIHEMNKRFRNMDKPTDVLSFPMIDFFEENPVMDKNENGEILLGDIVISIETMMAQANEYGHSWQREVGFLTAHSMLHLLGYDHMTDEEEKEMFKKQDVILNNANLHR